MAKKNDLIEKAKHQPGDVHPKYPNYTWQEKNGKWDWRVTKKGASNSQASQGSNTTSEAKQDNSQNQQSQPSGGQQSAQQSNNAFDIKTMTHMQLVAWAKKTNEKVLAEIVNKTDGHTPARQVAYDELKERGADVSQLDTDGLDTGFANKKAKVKYKSAPKVEISLPTTFKVKDKNGKTKTLSSAQQAKLYEGLDDAKLLKILNSPTLPAENRHIAYAEAASRGIDESKIKTAGTLQRYWDRQEQLKNVTNQSQNTEEDDEDYSSYTQPWLEGFDTEEFMQEFPNGDQGWRDSSDYRVQEKFNKLRTLSDRQRYDAFLDQQKRQDENYVPPVEQIQDLNAEYLDFLDGDASSFLISAGGAGVGKTWGFKKLCELLNLQEFDPETMKEGDDDYDWVVADNIKSEKALNEFLAKHNGKIILFDDNDAVLTRQDMKAVMKTVNDNDPKSRLFKDPNTGHMTRFTGKIACITNKSLDSLSDTEDGRAVLSRAKKLEVKMTVEENLEILSQRYKSMNIDGLDLGSDESRLREEAYQFILDNKDKLDPAKFTVRKFRDIMLDIQSARRRNQFSGSSAMASQLVGSGRDWRKVAMVSLNKADDDELNEETEEEVGEKRPSDRVKQKIAKLKKKNPKLANQLFGDAAADHFDDTDIDDESDEETKKALQADFGDMSLEDAEDLLLG